MIDISNQIFTVMANRFDKVSPEGSRYSEPVDAPARFPCMTVVEVNNSTYERSLDASHKENHAVVVYQVDIYSNLTAGAKSECRNIMAMIDKEFLLLNFTRLSYSFVKNADKKITRMTARYRAVVGEDHRIYRR